MKKFSYFGLLSFITITMLFPGLASAYYYAYVPDLTNRKLHVINTDLGIMVDAISLIGGPRDVLISHSSRVVYVSTVSEEINGGVTLTASTINAVDTQSNNILKLIPIDYDNVRGMAISQDDTNLYITHKVGITKISNPFTTSLKTDISTAYRGNSMVLSKDDKYLFVVGSDDVSSGETDPSAVNYGISVVDTETMSEVTSYSLGTGKNSNHIVFDDTNKILFVAHRGSDEIESLIINNYDDVSTLELTSNKLVTLPSGSNPIALALNQGNSELYVALSYVNNETATGEGTVLVRDATDISATILFDSTADGESTTNQILISKEKSEYKSQGIVHPAALAVSDQGKIFLLKRLWSDKNGLYISNFFDYVGSRTGRRYINETNSLLVSNSASIFSNGKFIGANCDDCPTGVEEESTPFERPAAFNPLYVLFFVIVAFLRKRFY